MKTELTITPEVLGLLNKAIAAREAYDKVMQDTRFYDLIAPAKPLSADALNKRNEAARIRARAMQNLGEHIALVYSVSNDFPF